MASLEPMIKERKFKTPQTLSESLAELLIKNLTKRVSSNYGVMLSGGHTPLKTYSRVAASDIRVADNVYILFSDDRMVPPESPDSNYGNCRRMLKKIGIPPERVLHVRTDLPLGKAADKYDSELSTFLDADGQVGLALLGLGADGHTAGLFSIADILRGRDRWAMAVSREDFDRITVTPRLIRDARKVILVATGPEKAIITQRILDTPASFAAGQALSGARSVELWHSP